MSSKVVYGKHVVVDAETIIRNGALYVEGGRIADLGTYERITSQYPTPERIGSSDSLVCPGFVNAHGHGKGTTDFQRGAIDDTLETWKFRRYPRIDRYYDTLWTAICLLESGVTTTMHNHTDLADPDSYYDEFHTTVTAYMDSGIRLAFAPSLVNRNILVYGDNEEFVRSLSPAAKERAESIVRQAVRFGPEGYFDAVGRLKEDFPSARVQIMHGPLAPQWVTDDVLCEIKRQADEQGMRIHIHVQQTQLQKLYGLREYGTSLVEHLHDLGFLGKNVTCGHCVWISEQDIELLSATATSVTHHASCNLRVRNGIAPVFALLDRGVVVAVGMDDKELGDDKDFVEEMRMVAKLHRLPSHQLDSRHLLPRDCFRMGTQSGAEVLGFSDLVGTLHPGKQADVVLLDLKRMSEPFVHPGHNVIDLLIYRGRSSDVDTVLVGGTVLVKDGRLTRFDKQEVIRKIQESMPEGYVEEFAGYRRSTMDLRREIAAYFAPWFQEMEGSGPSPYYLVNSKR